MLLAALLALCGCSSGGESSDTPQQQSQQGADQQEQATEQAVQEDDGAEAAKGTQQAFVKELTLDHVYKKYDVTGDGVKDTFEIATTSTEDAFTDLAVLVNGKTVLSLTADQESLWFSVIPNLVTTANGNSFLDLECVDSLDVDQVNALYLLGEGALKPAIDYATLFDPSCGLHPFANVRSVKESDLVVRTCLGSYLLGSGFSCDFTYTVDQAGQVTLKEQSATNICYSLVPGFEEPKDGFLTTTQDLMGTRELGGAKVVNIASGHLLKPVAAQVLAGILYVEFQMEDGTSFWITKTGSATTPEELAEYPLPFQGLM